MFKKLRNKFLIINIVTISIMMVFAFNFIYFMTYKSVYAGVDMELRRVSEFENKFNQNHKDSMQNFSGKNMPPQRSIGFNIITTSDQIIKNRSSIVSLSDDFYEEAKEAVFSQNSSSGKFKLYGNYWAFSIQPHPIGYKITILDITSQHDFLSNLVYTFITVALGMLLVIFFISKFFANKSIAPIKESFDKQKQFIADASHELKTPLAVISTNVDVLLANDTDTIKNQSKWLFYIQSEVERMGKLTNDLLYLTRMDYSDAKAIFSKVNLSDAVESVILTMEAVIFENSIFLDYDIKPDLMVIGNLEQLKQVAMILLDNALKYTNPNGKVNISLKKNNNNAVLSIKNTGKGIPPENLSKIFDRFYRVDKSRSRESGGYGLGLAIAKAIVEQHKGRISVASILNDVTTFTVEIPLSQN